MDRMIHNRIYATESVLLLQWSNGAGRWPPQKQVPIRHQLILMQLGPGLHQPHLALWK